MNMKSSDVAIGLPFNVGQYAAMSHMVAEATGHQADRLVINMGDAHVYFSQIPLVPLQFQQARGYSASGSLMRANNVPILTGIDGITLEDFPRLIPAIENYTGYQPGIPYPVEV